MDENVRTWTVSLLLAGTLLSVSLLGIGGSAAAHVCHDGGSDCDGDSCSDDGDIHVHEDEQNDRCAAIPSPTERLGSETILVADPVEGETVSVTVGGNHGGR